jgi:acyl-CoA hydrolase
VPVADPAPAELIAAQLHPGMRVAVGDGAGAPTGLLADLTEAARSVGDIALLLGWCLELPAGFDPAAFREVRTVMGGFALRDLVADGSIRYVPDRFSGVPALLRGSLRPDLALLALAPRSGGWEWGSEVSWMRSLLDLPGLRVLVEEDDALPRAARADLIPSARGTVVARSGRPPVVGTPVPPTDAHRRIARHLAPYIGEGAVLQYGPGPVADALVEELEAPVAVRSGMLTDTVRRLEERGLLLDQPLGAYLWGSAELYAWAEGREVVDRVERTHAVDATGRALISVNAALEIDHTGAVNVERLGGHPVSGIGGHPDFAMAGHVSRGGLSVIVTTTRRRGESTLVERLSGPVSTPRSDVDLVVTELGAADLRGLDDEERRAALLHLWAR